MQLFTFWTFISYFFYLKQCYEDDLARIIRREAYKFVLRGEMWPLFRTPKLAQDMNYKWNNINHLQELIQSSQNSSCVRFLACGHI
jgi:hypothetical protein